MSMDFELVRAASERDATWVQALAQAEHLEVDLIALLKLPHARTYVVDPAAGFLTVWIVQDELQIQDIAVHSAFRRRGTGRALWRAALNDSRKCGVRLATLEVRESNSNAILFYRALGFGEVGRRARYYTNGEAALLLTLEVSEFE
jgi:[ribosomal protein S18]-alanine N-acetyltransferase